jgi:SAM-dependent methyltransferase
MSKNYLSTLLNTQKYELSAQLELKDRAFRTFDSLLRVSNAVGLRAGQHLLDLGSADGALVKVARSHGLIASGLDITDKIDFEKDPLPVIDSSVDVVTFVAVIEHLHSPENVLLEVMRVLKSGGAFILVTPNWRFSYRNFYDDPTHVRPYTEKSIRFLLNSYGFARVDVVPWLVCKPTWMWHAPFAFQLARFIPFRGTASRLVPGFLRGQSKSILAIGFKQAPPVKHNELA